jgi:hypothetical protein
VQYWQAWNEPNVNRWISPLWTSVNGQWVATGPDLYRGLLNAFYNGVKAADSSNVVLTAGAAPAGLPPGNIVMRPGYFWRRVFCLDDSQPPKPTGSCPGGPARFDVFAHHPYNPTGSPTQSAANPDDVAIPDMGRLTTPMNIAINAGTVYPKKAKPVWVTELAWESNPPDPNRVSLSAQASYLAGAFYVLLKQGVSEVTWFHLRDEPEGQTWTTSYQSGLYLRGSSISSDFPKPSLSAFKFPFTAYRTSSSAVELWGIAPQPNQNVAVQRLQGSAWTTAANITADDNRMFSKTLNLSNGTVLRAVQSGESSLSWTVGAAYP